MPNKVVSREEWLKARLELLAAEKEFLVNAMRDAGEWRCHGNAWKSPTGSRMAEWRSRSPISSTGAPS